MLSVLVANLKHSTIWAGMRKTLSWCHSLAVAGTKGPCGCSVAPPPAGVGRRMERRKAKNWWVGIRAV